MAKGRRTRRRGVRIPIIPSVIVVLPEITVGIAAAADAEAGASAGDVGAKALNRLASLYGQAPASSVNVGGVEFKFDLGTNVIAKISGALIHGVARWGGVTMPLGRHASLL